MYFQNRTNRCGMSLLELLACVAILGVLALVIIPRLGDGSKQAEKAACEINREVIQIQASLWKHQKGSFPAANLADIGTSVAHFPEGLPTCPVDGSSYTIDASAGNVIGHVH